jgi:hypothetical protein
VIRGWTQRLAQSEVQSPEQQQQGRAVLEECDRVTARINQFLGLTKVQLRPVDINLKPTGTVLQEQSMWGFTLPASYGWQEFAFSGLDRRAAGGSIALVLQYASGGRSATVQTGDGDGLLTSNDSGGSWSYNSNKALRSQLYGKVTRPGPTQYAVSHYLTGVHLAMQVGVTGRKVETTSGALNQPEICWGLWETGFDTDPTQADTNGDGAADWVVHGGGTLIPGSLTNGVWQTTGAALDTSPACDFDDVTIADLVFRSLVAGTGSAVFTINADRSGSVCVPLTAALQLEPDGTQSLTVARRKSDGTTETLIRVRGLPGGLVRVRLLIDPAADSVSVTAEGVHVGTYGYGVPATTSNDRFASVSSNGGAAEFSYVRVRILDRVPG